MTQPEKTPYDLLPHDVRQFFDSTKNLLMLYMKGTQKIEMMVGVNTKAVLEITGGPITKETIEDVLAHLAFYKRYFPKAGEASSELDSPEKIVNAMKAAWAEHAEAMERQRTLVLPAIPNGDRGGEK